MSDDIYLSPHNDDEALWGAYTCLRYRPRVIVVLRSHVEAGWSPPVHYETREAETAAACRVLGCDYEQWAYPDNDPPWEQIRAQLAQLTPGRVWAPLVEDGGHPHHNAIGSLAGLLWEQTRYYATYTHARGKTTTGKLVVPRIGWEQRKRDAMACYQSQASHPQTYPGFTEWPIDEYLS